LAGMPLIRGFGANSGGCRSAEELGLSVVG